MHCLSHQQRGEEATLVLDARDPGHDDARQWAEVTPHLATEEAMLQTAGSPPSCAGLVRPDGPVQVLLRTRGMETRTGTHAPI
eukprot:945481-Lingulodinium_polyedra.AAC.1